MTELPIPEELTLALAQNPSARERFDRLPPSHRNEYAKFVSEAKKAVTRAGRAAKSIEKLLESQ